MEINVGRTVFLILVSSIREREHACLLVESIRAFGGEFSASPIWLFEGRPGIFSSLAFEHPDVHVMPLLLPENEGSYIFSQKVKACAEAEKMAASNIDVLIWLNPECLILQPLREFYLAPPIDAALRPVHIRNIGIPTEIPLDEYWQRICKTVGLSEIGTSVETFVEGQMIHAYFNTHAFAVNPSRGLFRKWWRYFQVLVQDKEFQQACCADDPHKIFLHQAVLSTLLVKELGQQGIRILPPTYSYPYHLHQFVPGERRAVALNDLVCLVYEEDQDDPLNPRLVSDIEIQEPLRTWLARHVRS